MDRVRDLVAAGGVAVVLAQDRDRFAESLRTSSICAKSSQSTIRSLGRSMIAETGAPKGN